MLVLVEKEQYDAHIDTEGFHIHLLSVMWKLEGGIFDPAVKLLR